MLANSRHKLVRPVREVPNHYVWSEDTAVINRLPIPTEHRSEGGYVSAS